MVRRVTRLLPPAVVFWFMLLLVPDLRFYTGTTGNQNREILQRYIRVARAFKTIAQM